MNHPSRSTPAVLPVLALLMLLAACGGGSEEPAANANANASRPAAAPEAAPVPALTGAWSVTKINGAALRQVWPMTATATADELSIQSECRRFAWTYRQDRNIVQFSALPTRDCGRIRSQDEEQIERPFTLANIAMFSNEGREVEITGPGGRVTLVRR